MEGAVLVPFRDADIEKAFPADQVAEGILQLLFDRLVVIAVYQLGVQCPGKEVGEGVTQGDIPHRRSGSSPADFHGALLILGVPLCGNMIEAFFTLPTRFAEDRGIGYLQDIADRIAL